jgi:hypothetical protein
LSSYETDATKVLVGGDIMKRSKMPRVAIQAHGYKHDIDGMVFGGLMAAEWPQVRKAVDWTEEEEWENEPENRIRAAIPYVGGCAFGTSADRVSFFFLKTSELDSMSGSAAPDSVILWKPSAACTFETLNVESYAGVCTFRNF